MKSFCSVQVNTISTSDLSHLIKNVSVMTFVISQEVFIPNKYIIEFKRNLTSVSITFSRTEEKNT